VQLILKLCYAQKLCGVNNSTNSHTALYIQDLVRKTYARPRMQSASEGSTRTAKPMLVVLLIMKLRLNRIAGVLPILSAIVLVLAQLVLASLVWPAEVHRLTLNAKIGFQCAPKIGSPSPIFAKFSWDPEFNICRNYYRAE
jgi:hypothetical protein